MTVCLPGWLDFNLFLSLLLSSGHRFRLHGGLSGRHHRQGQAALQRQPDQAAVLHAPLLLLRLLRPLLVHEVEVIMDPGDFTPHLCYNDEALDQTKRRNGDFSFKIQAVLWACVAASESNCVKHLT